MDATQDKPAPDAVVAEVVSPPKRKIPATAFKPGHQKFGGRKKGAPLKRTKEARDIADKLGFSVVEWLIIAATTGILLKPDGQFDVLDGAQRLDAGKTVAKYLVPALTAVQVTGKDNGPIAVAALDVTELMKSPASLQAAQRLALEIAQRPQIAAPEVLDGDDLQDTD